MNAARHRLVGDLYHQALELAPDQREAFLRRACNGDDDLRHEVESLVAAHEDAGDFISRPAIEEAAAALAHEASGAAAPRPPFSRIGPYDVASLLGRGGMGEVYRARDPRLGRDVALKVLPERHALDAEHLERFEREARVLASLNHPNIAALYGIEEVRGRQALVMELVEGITLAERIASGPIPLAEALPIARQIGEALEAAHDRGFVHRDLKPANVCVRPDGTVKVLDFGLAKAIALGDHGADPMITARTGAGAMVGTASYMSPEQARGATVDRRTDIWAFGCVLFEMLTGERAFAGDSTTDVIARIIEREPDFDRLPATTPAAVARVLRRCLRKSVRERLRHIGDAVLELNEASEADASNRIHATPVPVRIDARTRIVWIGASLAAVALTAVGVWQIARDRPAPLPVSRTVVAFPASAPLVVSLGSSVAISNDGQYLAAKSNGGAWTIRRRDRLDVTMVGGNGLFIAQPFFSPDGEWLGFGDGAGTAPAVLKRVPTRGGTPVRIASLPGQFLGATWGADGAIVYATDDGLYRVSADGGVPQLIRAADHQRGEVISWPEFLPGGRWLLSTITGRGTALPARVGDGSVVAIDLRTGERRTVLPGVTHARYLPTGHLVYTSSGTLYAVPFDSDRLDVGEPVPLMTDVRDDDFALSAQGTLAYVSGNDSRRQLVWVDRSGREESISAPPGRYVYPSLSPDGTKVALDIDGPDRNIWVFDLRRETMTRLTFDPAEDLLPIWTPDGTRILFSRRVGAARLYSQAADGSGTATLLNDASSSQMALSVTSDGKRLVFSEGTNDVSVMALDGSRRVEPLLTSGAREMHGMLSPDGRWLAYSSDETGEFNVFVRPFPDTRQGKWQISTSGGSQPLWSRDGLELYYRDPAGAVMASSVKPRPSFLAGAVAKLFDGASYSGGGNVVQGRTYDISPDGRRFLLIKMPPPKLNELPANNSLVLVQNWFDEVRRLAPAR